MQDQPSILMFSTHPRQHCVYDMPPVIDTDVIDSEVNLNIIVTNFTGSFSLSASNYNSITLGPFFKKGTYVAAEHRKKIADLLCNHSSPALRSVNKG